jgi:tyrosine-protein phosphatase YwqE
MFSLFKKKAPLPDLSAAPNNFSFLGTDMHSHLVPGIDDGAPDIETSLDLIRRLKDLGYSKLITTPHVQLEFFDNNAEKITGHFARLKRFIDDQRIGVELGIGAEYYLDNFFLPSVFPDGLLSFGEKRYVLVEVSMAGWPRTFSDMIFTIQSQGYTPVLAHPERYLFEDNIKVYQEWKGKGVLFQMNLLALTGYYGKGVKEQADRYLKEELYDFCGTDTHHPRHVEHLARMARDRPDIMHRLSEYPHFLNSSL